MMKYNDSIRDIPEIIVSIYGQDLLLKKDTDKKLTLSKSIF